MTIERRTYSIEEAARIVGVSRSTAFNQVHSGEWQSVKVGRRLLIPRVFIQRLLGEAPDSLGNEASPR